MTATAVFDPFATTSIFADGFAAATAGFPTLRFTLQIPALGSGEKLKVIAWRKPNEAISR